ncbi:metal-dependent hydrolase [Burkholderia sp. SRS-W-2-2016]|uniref:metal-dependent hydrolase n=1 Tax=Burkholderia sp. SRS-W-2-2016 TaxID=1926878 RepID=UPI00094AC5D1|nr:metal-dependent hydrolase [Burkholderia sp. SRS-W-2-2016]OLL28907.1 metal-dependent hydrolase [Burkholderia sp. SRS-W-2-2016]
MMPVRRDLRFNLPAERACDWHAQGSHVTHFYNALSLLFPAGERFFMDSVRNYRDQIDDPELKKQVLGFIGQEAMHTREHIEYNDLLQQAGLPAHKLDNRLLWFLNQFRKYLPHSYQLAITVCLEHYTAMLAAILLEDSSRIAGSVEGYTQMWTWHALEETEHKSVSYDVWNAVLKPGLRRYLLRTGTMLTTTLIFWLIVFDYNVRLIVADRKRGGHLRGLWRLTRYVWGPRRGVLPSIAGEWLSFFRPGFHPWDHDNRDQLARIDGLVAAVDAANAGLPATRHARRGVRAAA